MASKPSFRNTFHILKNKNYLLFFTGQGISLIGTWMQRIAMSWLVYRLTNSAFLLGIVGFASQFPTFLFAPFAGVLADRLNRRQVLLVTQTLSMFQAFTLAYLVIINEVTIWHIIILGTLLGIINAFDTPVRQSFTIDIVEHKEDLKSAIVLNSSLVNSARLLGPSIAGLLISFIGEGMCFLVNGVSYIAVIMALLAMNITPKTIPNKKQNLWLDFREGSSYTFHSVPICTILLLLALVSLMGMPYTVLMPIFATDILHGGAHTLGFLMASIGIGALTGALFLGSRANIDKLEQCIFVSAGIFGLGLIAFSLTHTLALSIPALMITGFGMMVQMAASNTMLQSIVADDMRGRVMSFYTMSFMGMVPFGSLLAGSLANTFGTVNTIIIGGVSCLVGALLFAYNFYCNKYRN